MIDKLFKIWIPYTGIMTVFKPLHLLHEERINGPSVGEFSQWRYIQWIGAKDQEGKLVAEGDLFEDSEGNLHEVVFDPNFCRWCTVMLDEDMQTMCASIGEVALDDFESIVITGNIFQVAFSLKDTNPDLWKRVNEGMWKVEN